MYLESSLYTTEAGNSNHYKSSKAPSRQAEEQSRFALKLNENSAPSKRQSVPWNSASEEQSLELDRLQGTKRFPSLLISPYFILPDEYYN